MIKHLAISFLLAIFTFTGIEASAQNYGRLMLRFNVVANDKALVLSDSVYTNSFNETYQLTRLKYYISNVNPSGNPLKQYNDEVFLIETGATDSLWIDVLPGSYNNLFFTIGVDSSLNNSGAQSGALDPLNGMFWTWNSGYIFFKMEGYSPSSKADLNRIEHHVGGYRNPYNTARQIVLKLPAKLEISPGSVKVIDIKVNIDHYWQGVNDIKIADQALLMTPGPLAVRAADNFQNMFSIIQVR